MISEVSGNHLKIGAGITIEEIEYNKDIKVKKEKKKLSYHKCHVSNTDLIYETHI